MTSAKSDLRSPRFDAAFRSTLRDLILWRRDVRRFKPDPVEPDLVASLIALAGHAPSVGHSQPWRFVLVESADRRAAVCKSFERANAQAIEGYCGDKRQLYAKLKLEGLREAPAQLAVFADEATQMGSGLGSQSMPETLRYSVVGAVQTLWLCARAHGLGVGWVSILEPETVAAALDVPETWKLVAYLCIGWPEEEHIDPELQRSGWESSVDASSVTFRR
jgi:5,6-dimethylbenzimidazole synthase